MFIMFWHLLLFFFKFHKNAFCQIVGYGPTYRNGLQNANNSPVQKGFKIIREGRLIKLEEYNNPLVVNKTSGGQIPPKEKIFFFPGGRTYIFSLLSDPYLFCTLEFQNWIISFSWSLWGHCKTWDLNFDNERYLDFDKPRSVWQKHKPYLLNEFPLKNYNVLILDHLQRHLT